MKHLPTYYGTLDYSIRNKDGSYLINISGDMQLPAGGFKISPLKNENIESLAINGKKSSDFDNHFIYVNSFPATIKVQYKQ